MFTRVLNVPLISAYSQLTFTYLKLAIGTLKQGVNMLKVHNEDTRTNDSRRRSRVFIVSFDYIHRVRLSESYGEWRVNVFGELR